MLGKSSVLAFFISIAGLATADDLALEPCINGAVSSNGKHPSQAAEDQVNAYLDWRLNQPHYAFWGRGAVQRHGLSEKLVNSSGGEVFSLRTHPDEAL